MATNKRTCSIPGCTNPHSARGWRTRHYGKWRKTGNPSFEKSDLRTRFFDKVHKTESCWYWTGFCDHNGYGKFWNGNRTSYAHVESVKIHGISVPEGWQVDHLCKNTSCVNPNHLEPVTAHENNMRSDSTAAKNAVKEFCKRGHPFNGSNTYWRPDGTARQCLTCRREADGKRRRSKAA